MQHISFVQRVFPKSLWNKSFISAYLAILSTFLLFNLLWCIQTTFSSWQKPDLYINIACVSLILMLPYMLFHNSKIHFIELLLLDILLICNLMYNRTYNTVIPLDSYFHATNLNDFKAAALDQIRWYDILLPLKSIIYLLWTRKQGKQMHPRWTPYLCTMCFIGGITASIIALRGGIEKAFQSLQDKNFYTCAGPIYTVFGCALHDYLHQNTPLSPEEKKEIEAWLDARPHNEVRISGQRRKSLVVIFCESLESWVLNREVEGKEIMPYLNQELRNSTTLYASHVLTQVRGGRSIDGQLLLLGGQLPISNGSYAFLYPNNTFYTLPKALSEKGKTITALMTVDKSIIWNQGQIAKRFGISQIFAKDSWNATEAVGAQKNLPDVPFFEQATERMKQIWEEGTGAYMQLVTYSGHAPFKLPTALQRIKLSDNYPEKLHDYLVTANYTDYALGQLIHYLKSRKDYKDMLVVIVGDHEGLAGDRAELCASKAGKGLVDAGTYTPLIILNSPVGMHYEKVMGQVDQYSTLLDLLQLNDYPWRGMGQSILSPNKYPIAIGSNLNIEGDLTNVPKDAIEHLKRSYHISDLMIQHDYLKQRLPQ